MTDHRDLFERRAQRGEPRGAQHVIDAAHRDHGATPPTPPDTRAPSGLRRVLVAALVLVVAGVGGFALLGQLRPSSTDSTSLADVSATTRKLCEAAMPPAGAVAEDAPLVACSSIGGPLSTADRSANRWSDTVSSPDVSPGDLRSLDADYTVSVVGELDNVGAARTAEGWLVDVIPGDPDLEVRGGAVITPRAAFEFVDGSLVVEAQLLLGHDDYQSTGWYEIVVTPEALPTGNRLDGLYVTDVFPGAWTVGCRFEAGGHTVCVLNDETDDTAPADPTAQRRNDRVWQASAIEMAGTDSFGGFSQPELGLACGCYI